GLALCRSPFVDPKSARLPPYFLQQRPRCHGTRPRGFISRPRIGFAGGQERSPGAKERFVTAENSVIGTRNRIFCCKAAILGARDSIPKNWLCAVASSSS